MTGDLDRRAFLGRAGAAGLVLAGGSAAAAAAASRVLHLTRVRAASPSTLQAAIRGHVFRPGTPGFISASHVYNERFDSVLPTLLARPVDATDVRDAVRWLIDHGKSFRARSGGHSYAGYGVLSGGVVVDLRKLTGLSVNHSAGTATIGAGSQLIDVYNGLAAHGVMLPGGSCPSVGIAGVTLGGGMGLAARKYGLSVDNMVGAQIVTADGNLHTVNAHSNPDLFWALRGGGGGNFGIVTQFVFKVHPLPSSASYFFVHWPWSSASEAIEAWQSWAPHATSNITSIFHLSAGGSATVSVSGQYFGPSSNLHGLLGPLLSVPGASVSSGSMGYMNLQLLFAGCQGLSVNACHTVGASSGGTLARAFFNAKSDYVGTPLPSAARQKLISAIDARLGLSGSGAILFDSYGGAINSIAPGATAFVHRNELFCIQYLTYNDSSSWLGNTWQGMRPYVSGQAYQNYIDHNQPNWQHAYYGNNYGRLKSVRQTVDPHHVFNFPQAIGR